MQIPNFVDDHEKIGIVIMQAMDAGAYLFQPIEIPFTTERDSPYVHKDPMTIFKIKIANFFHDNDLIKYHKEAASITFILNSFSDLDLPEGQMVYLPQTNQLTTEKRDYSSQYCVIVIN
jgi:hypothetical protein